MSSPGILLVTMTPKPGLSLSQFHEWYNNEHGPTRLRLPQIFSNGFRYKATSHEQPAFMAVYHVTAMKHLETETYTALRANRSNREANIIGQVDVNRYFFDLLYTKQSSHFTPIEHLTDEEAEGLVAVAVEINVSEADGAGDQYQQWFVQEHAELIAKVPGWLRSRLFRTSSLGDAGKAVYLCLFDYEKQNGLGGAAHAASMDTPWRTEVFGKYVASKKRQTWSLFRVFGPAATDLASLSELSASAAFTSTGGDTTTRPGSSAVISSYVTTKDSLNIRYRLEGNPSPTAPTVAFSNSLLTSLHMWDSFVAVLKKNRPGLRILRYDTRGRCAIPQPPVAATLDTLTDDLNSILDSLRIARLDTLVGVSLGGATTLNFAIKSPARLGKFIACDFNATSSPANTQAWKDRVAIARADSGQGIKKLAVQTVERWFHPMTMEKGHLAQQMTDMVAENDVEGFANSCTALWDYDIKPDMKGCRVPGLFLAGEADAKGAVVKAMDGFKGLLGDGGAELRIVPLTGHLPMFEDADAFYNAVKDYL
ncbi:Dimeric alpha-beta barrel [Metarhizium album ARSEF 1941]|uniref:Dimeric alpha-beta barrel n=1 Tax=Metarhizium album (strain ARSEF 1941) TaxID=1081103 RepID=A0A0B2WZT8_METAS|nr:Dimeric alpha-beta barrel [Metarhizium album ARSEF 1941]KHN98345.1 Dimeric alpha-beta barrel [Metarhizium album ARSEF 1941]